MKTYLQVKIASLAAEARIIRGKERTALETARYAKRHNTPDVDISYKLYHELYRHRTWDVRHEARAAQLALGFLRGRAYQTMELKTYTPPHWFRVAELVRKYGGVYEKMPTKRLAELLETWAEMKAATPDCAAFAMSIRSQA